jgi:Skp family chaperone for outer membrane proteins
MRVLKTLIVVGVLSTWAAGPAVAQTTPPAQPPSKPTQPPATGQPPATTPTTPAPAPTPAAAPRPYPEGAKIAYVDIQAVASGSSDGKIATSKLQDFEKKKVAEIQAKNKQLEDARTKQQTSSNIMNDSSRLALEKEVDKLTREVQFLQQEAQSERNALQTELQVEFQRRLNPILEQVSKEKGLHMLVDIQNSGAVWVDTGLDLTAEVIKRLDAAKSTAPVKK